MAMLRATASRFPPTMGMGMEMGIGIMMGVGMGLAAIGAAADLKKSLIRGRRWSSTIFSCICNVCVYVQQIPG